MRKRKRVLIVMVVLVMLASLPAILAVDYLRDYYRSLLPELLFEAPAEEYPEIIALQEQYPRDRIHRSGEIVDACNARGFTSGPFLMTFGYRATRLKPDEFHSSKASVVIERADEDVLYFYRYDRKYEGGMLDPWILPSD
jgi:hypothetical protein